MLKIIPLKTTFTASGGATSDATNTKYHGVEIYDYSEKKHDILKKASSLLNVQPYLNLGQTWTRKVVSMNDDGCMEDQSNKRWVVCGMICLERVDC